MPEWLPLLFQQVMKGLLRWLARLEFVQHHAELRHPLGLLFPYALHQELQLPV